MYHGARELIDKGKSERDIIILVDSSFVLKKQKKLDISPTIIIQLL